MIRREMAEWRATSTRSATRVTCEPLSLPVALFPPVSPVSLESGIGDCSRSAHELCGLDSASSQLADDSYVMRLRNTTLYQPVSYTRSTWQAAEKLFWHVRTSIVSHVAQQNNTPAGCSKRPFGK